MTQKKLQKDSILNQYDLDGDNTITDEELQRAKEIGATSLNIVISPSDEFNIVNQNTTYDKAKDMYEEISTQCSINRVYISCCFNPNVSEKSVLDCVKWGNKIGKYVILCDTDSFANSDSVFSICSKAKNITPNIGIHFHISQNIEECIQSAYDAGVRIFDTSSLITGSFFLITS